ncbi:MAG: TrkH family potassium uptake protein, partial [Clostridiaceae bacterium]|nr:TrkH family potassium uptake protein [Clostridiaceae bacterium]
MNYKVVLKLVGNVLKYELALLLIPLLVGVYYGSDDINSFIYTILCMLPITILLCSIRTKKTTIYAKEGFFTVGIAWLVISAVGALPFV